MKGKCQYHGEVEMDQRYSEYAPVCNICRKDRKNMKEIQKRSDRFFSEQGRGKITITIDRRGHFGNPGTVY